MSQSRAQSRAMSLVEAVVNAGSGYGIAVATQIALTVSNKQLELMAKFMAEIGLTPSSRSRLAIQVPTGPKPWEYDPAAEFLGDDEDDLLAKPWN